MLSAIIIEDEKLAREVLISLLEQFFGDKINILGEVSNVNQDASLIQKYQPQLVFLDIQLRGLTGLNIFNNLAEQRCIEVVSNTAHKEQANTAIRSGAFDYNLKPIAIDDLSDMLKRLEVHLNTKIMETAKAMPAKEDENSTKQNSKLVIPTANGYSLENKELIIYCEGMGNYTKIYLSTGKEMIMSKTLKSIELSLGDNFCRIHKSYLVNNNHILRYSRSNGYKITLTNDTVLDVSYRNNEKVLQILKKISN